MFSFFWKINIISDAQSVQSADKTKILGWKHNKKKPSIHYHHLNIPSCKRPFTQIEALKKAPDAKHPTDSPTIPVPHWRWGGRRRGKPILTYFKRVHGCGQQKESDTSAANGSVLLQLKVRIHQLHL